MRYCIIILFFFSCKKQEAWLDKKSNKADIVPSTIADFQAILDNDGVMNAGYPGLGLIGTDNYYITFAVWQARAPIERNSYIWNPEIFEGGICSDWNNPYRMIEYANIAIDGISKITTDITSQKDRDLVMGSALFYRAYAFYDLAQLFSKPYDKATASSDPSIPLRLSSDVNVPSVRATIQETYDRIIKDLQQARELLPASPAFKTRPSKKAALALLSRVSLAMEDYINAELYSSEAIKLQGDLIDFNTLNAAASFPMPTFQADNKEVLFYSITLAYSTLSNANMRVDTFLYRSYATNDLRRNIFYKDNGVNGVAFRGDYTGQGLSSKFAGIALNEIYLNRAEAYARLGKTTEAMADLNALLVKRWKAGTFITLTATGPDDALQKIIIERKKELPFTGNLPWHDLRRLNKEPRFTRTLTRVLNGQVYSLPAGDLRYVYPIPDNEIKYSGIPQNPR